MSERFKWLDFRGEIQYGKEVGEAKRSPNFVKRPAPISVSPKRRSVVEAGMKPSEDFMVKHQQRKEVNNAAYRLGKALSSYDKSDYKTLPNDRV